ncbi:hypothetical protein [Streptomyces antimycoticus]|nr:hypothetical protein [Streptomyces antimycoticus]
MADHDALRQRLDEAMDQHGVWCRDAATGPRWPLQNHDRAAV